MWLRITPVGTLACSISRMLSLVSVESDGTGAGVPGTIGAGGGVTRSSTVGGASLRCVVHHQLPALASAMINPAAMPMTAMGELFLSARIRSL